MEGLSNNAHHKSNFVCDADVQGRDVKHQTKVVQDLVASARRPYSTTSKMTTAVDHLIVVGVSNYSLPVSHPFEQLIQQDTMADTSKADELKA